MPQALAEKLIEEEISQIPKGLQRPMKLPKTLRIAAAESKVEAEEKIASSKPSESLQTPLTTPQKEEPAGLDDNIIREIRFAVVMYGGVSLAIYIHGVSRELFHLVRATARKPDGDAEQGGEAAISSDQLTGSERVYRKLSHLLAIQQKSQRIPTAEELENLVKNNPLNAGQVRFIVDIISGTSAGGINGVFLAKALANEQTIQPLRDLWLEDGDLQDLLNDGRSKQGFPDLTVKSPPASLLNSQRMYRLLLKALDKMDPQKAGGKNASSAYVQQLDLFVTATDIRGLPLDIRLADKVVWERRYRNVFHFIFGAPTTGTARNDFASSNDPFLAFAARCTSAFPFAFEPMQLGDAIDLTPFDIEEEAIKGWKEFYGDYGNPKDKLDFKERSFGDGGYLDNKPFSYVTDALKARRADVPVDRKVLYVEPSPDHPELEATQAARPDVFENVRAALFQLPRQETIRQDIQALGERNRFLERLQRINRSIGRDIDYAKYTFRYKRIEPELWRFTDLTVMVQERGLAYVAYHRLKIADTTDELAELIANLRRIPWESDNVPALREVIRCWRDRRYVEYHAPGQSGSKEGETQNAFLSDFDFNYQARRLLFLLDQLKELEKMDESAKVLVKNAVGSVYDGGGNENYAIEPEEFRKTLHQLRRILNDHLRDLRDKWRQLNRGKFPEVTQPIVEMTPNIEAIEALLQCRSEETRREAACRVCDSVREPLNLAMETLGKKLQKWFGETKGNVKKSLADDPNDSIEMRVVKYVLNFYFEHFDEFDAYIYPLLYATDGQETSAVEIIRVSPEDATRLIDEKNCKCHKLGGDSFGHFGGFMDPLWRRNDMLWGRLDAIERIVSALFPENNGDALLDELIGEAQAAVFAEEIDGLGLEYVQRLIVEGFMRPAGGQPDFEAMKRFVTKLQQGAKTPDVRAVLEKYLSIHLLQDCYQTALVKDRRPCPRPSLESATRATKIVGEMLDGLSDKYSSLKRPAAWMSRVGRIGWTLVELAVPDRMLFFLARHWLKVLGLCGLILVVLGIVITKANVGGIGLLLLATVFLAHVFIKFANRLICNGWGEARLWRWVLEMIAVIGVIVFVTFAIIGFFHVGECFKSLGQSDNKSNTGTNVPPRTASP